MRAVGTDGLPRGDGEVVGDEEGAPVDDGRVCCCCCCCMRARAATEEDSRALLMLLLTMLWLRLWLVMLMLLSLTDSNGEEPECKLVAEKAEGSLLRGTIVAMVVWDAAGVAEEL